MSKRLANKTIAITGGTSGIGLASAIAFVREGARISLLGRSQAKIDTAISAITNALGTDVSDRVTGAVGDVADLASLKAFFQATADALGGIDGVFANAGVGDRPAFVDVDEATFDRINAINFKGAFFTVQYALPHLKPGASLVLTGSCLDEMGVATLSVYSATKAALRSLARSLTPELKPYGARVNVLSPGPVITEIEKKLGMSDAEHEAYQQYMAGVLAAGRMGTVDEMAAVAVFLVSDESSFMYGSEIQADGGMNQTRFANG
ncbi:MAG: SDR family oxidoreductase [Planctomycetota bacterium]|jgi:NAD(P)-dependent dehydrogenase (short-subunit alcohol dehydrogenase family)